MNERIHGLAFDRSRAGIDRRSFLRLAAVAGAAGPLLETGLDRAAWGQTPKKGGTLTVGINTDIVSLDPNDIVFANVPMFFQLYDYLVTFGTNLEPQPSLAESWELAKDGASATFKLRENVRTHSGGAFDADALLANFQRVKDKATGGGLFSRLEDFTAADKLDARTVRFRFARPRPDFLAMVSRWGMVDPAAFATAQAEGRRDRAVQARRVGARRPPDVRAERQLLAARAALSRPGRLPGAERCRRDGERVPRGPDRRGPHDPQQGRPAAPGRGPAGAAGPRPQRVLRRHPQHAEAALRQPARSGRRCATCSTARPSPRRSWAASARPRSRWPRPARQPTTRSSTRSSPSTPRRPASSSRRRGSPARRPRSAGLVSTSTQESPEIAQIIQGDLKKVGIDVNLNIVEPSRYFPIYFARELRDLVPVPHAGDDRSDRLHDQLGLPAEPDQSVVARDGAAQGVHRGDPEAQRHHRPAGAVDEPPRGRAVSAWTSRGRCRPTCACRRTGSRSRSAASASIRRCSSPSRPPGWTGRPAAHR